MKYATLIPLVAAATRAAVIARSGDQAVLQDTTPSTDELWWSDGSDSRYIESIKRFMENAVETTEEAIGSAVHNMGEALGSLLEGSDSDVEGTGKRGGNRRCHDCTIWDMIKDSEYTRRFTKLVNEFPDVKDRLKDRKGDWTLFVPMDSAFENLPEKKKPSREFLEEILMYHLVPGRYGAGRIERTNTLPTALELRDLGHHHQRLRISVDGMGTHVNFYSRLVAKNIEARNGVIHAVDHILVPPPRQGRLIDMLPGRFSTFSLAMEKTALAVDLHQSPQRGGTVFVPTNEAFAKLGPMMNAFLFSAQGEKYLRALMRYHVSTNETLYSDAYIDRQVPRRDRDDRRRTHMEDDDESIMRRRNNHVDMRSELGRKRVSVDVRRNEDATGMTVNGWIPISVQDAIR